ncbi:M36 family metallopeptidase [Aquipuribacter nitratireducens]|uniref:M36 family metallopeptidase n=1 Tax=Aquipuribacter nitratireducens TaxID=650104 RepID=A0ABW0GJU4_9MICO
MRARRTALVTAPVVLGALLAAPLPGQAAPAAEAAPRPGFLTAPSDADATDIAVDFVQQNAAGYGVLSADVADLVVRSAYESRHSGVTHVNLYQRHDGLEVFGGTATVNVARDGSIVHAASTLVRDLSGAEAAEATGPVEAVEAVAEELHLDEPEDLRPTVTARTASPGEVTLTDGGISAEPIPTRLGWQPTASGLRPAYQVVIDDAESPDLWNAVVDAETGELLDLDNWTIEHTHDQLASTLARGAATATTQAAAHDHAADDAHDHAGEADLGPSTHAPEERVEDGSSYRVYEIPKESPNDGPRTVVENPADADASPFGWHDTDGVAGPEFTITRGNNVHAYLDRDNNNAPDPGGDVDGGPSLDFDFELDLADDPTDYQPAAVTNLFYLNNVIHDVMHGYGFDEVSGNFQVNNYGRGGTGGDVVRAEAQDGGGTNNANFSTPAADGSPPRMQMYLWNPGGGVLPFQVVVDAPSPAAGTYGASGAGYGPEPTVEGLSGTFALAEDGSGTNEGCSPFVGFPAGAIAVVDRGTCPFVTKTANADAAGASAVVVVNNAPGAPISLGGSLATDIPSVMVRQEDGQALKAGLPATGTVRADANIPPRRDGDLENGIVIHEYGHGISNRLTGGLNVNCLSGNEQMGEGWSDYYAIVMLMDPAVDDPEAARGMGPYALYQDDRSGAGIRPAPYSRDMTKQPFTYDRIRTGGWVGGTSLAVPHGIGHTWAATLWDMTWDLVDRHGFNDNVYDDWDAGGNNRSLQYVTDGLKMQGCAPGFVAGRDGILAAERALTGGEDQCLIWNAFARRGLGYSAVQGTTNRDDNTEAFDVPPTCEATGAGVVSPKAGADGLVTRDAGSAIPVDFSLGADRGLDVLKPAHSPASREVSCETGEVVQYALTTPADAPGETVLRYNRARDRYSLIWETDEAWAGTCRELVIVLEDGTQHTMQVRLTEPTD